MYRPLISGHRLAAVDVAADDRAAAAVPVDEVGVLEAARVAGRLLETLKALDDVPTVVAAGDDQIDLLPPILANIARPELPRLAVEREVPGVTQPVGVDLTPGEGCAREGIVGRYRVTPRRADVNPQESSRGGRRGPGRSSADLPPLLRRRCHVEIAVRAKVK